MFGCLGIESAVFRFPQSRLRIHNIRKGNVLNRSTDNQRTKRCLQSRVNVHVWWTAARQRCFGIQPIVIGKDNDLCILHLFLLGCILRCRIGIGQELSPQSQANLRVCTQDGLLCIGSERHSNGRCVCRCGSTDNRRTRVGLDNLDGVNRSPAFIVQCLKNFDSHLQLMCTKLRNKCIQHKRRPAQGSLIGTSERR